jgi:uncharacterized membrane protein
MASRHSDIYASIASFAPTSRVAESVLNLIITIIATVVDAVVFGIVSTARLAVWLLLPIVGGAAGAFMAAATAE